MKIEFIKMRFKCALLILAVFFYSNIVNAQNTLNNIGLTSSTPASVAYSLRLLSSSYAGPLVRIKVGSLFYDVYPDATNKFSLNSKISASISTYNAAVSGVSINALSTIISGSTDATVAIWYDQSGNAIHVLSSSAGASIITAGNINTLNGQPTIKFSGTTSFLASVATVNYSAQSGATVNIIAQNIATNSVVGGIISTASGVYPGYNTSYTTSKGYQSDGDGCGYGSNVITNDPKMITSIFINTTTNLSKIYVNGVLKTNTAVTANTCQLTNTSGSLINIGACRGQSNWNFNGNISEAFIFPNQMSAGDQTLLETNQTAFYFAPLVTITSSATGAICAGTNVTFTANINGFTSTPTYQWYKNGTAITGATSATYSTTTLSNNDVISASAIPASVSASTVTSNLIANLDAGNSSSYNGSGNTWTDLTGNGNNVALSNTGYSTVNGGGIALNTNGYGTQTLSSPPFNGDFTWSTIFRFNDGMWDWLYNVGGYNGLILTVPGKPGFSWGGWYNNKIDANAESSLTNGNYYMLTFVRSGNAISCYLQASPYGVGSNVSGNISLVSPLIGKAPDGSATWPNGIVNLILLYNRALNQTEITQNYNTYAARFGFSAAGISSNKITTTISAAPSANITVNGDACVNKTTLSTTSGLSSYAWYKDNVAISGATSNTYTPSASGAYQVTVSNGTCSSTSSAATISNCSVAADGSMKSISNASSIISPEGGANFGTGRDINGKLFNVTGLTTVSGTIGSTTAIIGGIISPTNSVTNSIGVIYSTDINFGTYSSTTIQSNVAAGTYSTSITGLAATTNYFTKSFIVNKAGTSYGPVLSFTTTSPPVALGGQSQGGTVAYIYKSGDPGYVAGETHGIIMSNSFVNPTSSTKWSAETNPIATNATGTALGTGLTNSNTIYTAIGNNAIAVNLCRNYSVVSNGVTYTNWYLPSINEWSKIIATRSAGSLPSFDYRSDATFTNVVNVWTSSEVSASDVIMINIGNGGYFNVTKTLNINDYGYIRAIRYF